ncbi:hypothetical protein NUV89_12300 [Pseudomonas sp. 18.1.10]|uniref:hypothetical protein n=1 Tax=Pseudomonas sp. 18.1.10 TaxID=2969302 RepID=UPI00215035D5|nr:hypothetical protein [Pseudomonas sp. 18.1.10]MCR4539179.1 hypothetical protein [Pseudomonas sp. 18.1.10]
MMDLFFSSTSSFVNNIQQVNNTPAPAPAPQPPKPTQGPAIDFSGGNTDNTRKTSGSIDSLGSGNII